MLRNYLKTAFRSLQRDAGYSLLNVLGIASGIAACLLIGLFVRSEWSYDRFHENSDRLYRAWVNETYEDRDFTNTITPLPLAPALEAQIPDVEAAVRVRVRQDLVQNDDRQFRERIHAVDADFFGVFSFPLLKGDPKTALSSPGQVVITDAVARKYFGTANALGESLQIRNGDTLEVYTVAGIAEAPPVESSIRFDIVTPFEESSFREASRTGWFQVYVETYVLLRASGDADRVREQLPSMVEAAIGEEEMAESQYKVDLQPITLIHLDTSLPPGIEATSSPVYSLILGAIGLLVLLVASINFVTLAVGRSTERALEVGVRKVMGADRRQLMGQFWGEALITTSVAFGIGWILVGLGRPVFESLAGRPFSISPDGFTVLLAVGLLGVVVAIAGGYPALVLSGLRPVDIFKGRLPIGSNRGILRVLLGFQFAVSGILLIALFVMHQQIRFLQDASLGYTTEQVVTIPTAGSFGEGMQTYERLHAELQGVPNVSRVAAASFTPDQPWMTVEFADGGDGFYRFRANLVSYDYIETMGIEVVAGRSFDRSVSSDTTRGILINKAMVEQMGWEDPLEETLPGMLDHEIVGVVSDFHYASLHQRVQPLVLTANPDLVLRGAANVMIPSATNTIVTVRLGGGDIRASMQNLETAWSVAAAGQPFDYTFLDRAIDQQYRQEQRFAEIVGWASGLAVLVACFGLFALVVLMTQHRQKEIGIRRTLGATTFSIVRLFSWEFVRVVAIAFAVAVPVSYLAVQRWLSDFAYHVDVGIAPFAFAAGIVLLLTLLTVGSQSFRSGQVDPAKTLRAS